MPLVGLIEPGTVERVVTSVAYAKANVLVLLEQEHRSGHILFEKGEIVTARVGDRTGTAAVEEMLSWFAGHYSLLKRQQKETTALGHVLLNSLDLKTRRTMERWLKRRGFTTSIVGYPQHALQVVSYIQPEVVLMPCPRTSLQLSCSELRAMLAEELGVPPLLIVVETAGSRCERPDAECVRTSDEIAGMQALLSQPWPETRLSVRAQSQESTARVFRPAPLPADLRHARLKTDDYGSATAGAGRITGKDVALLMVVLLLGSGLVWSVWWAMLR